MGHHLPITAPLCIPLSPWGELKSESSDEEPTPGKEKFWLRQLPGDVHFPHTGWLCRGHWYPSPPPKVGLLNLCLLASVQEDCLISFVHGLYSSPSRGTRCPVGESPPSWDPAQTLAGWSSAHMFLDSKFAKGKCMSLPTLCCAGGFDSCTASSCHWQGGRIDRGQKSSSWIYHFSSL